MQVDGLVGKHTGDLISEVCLVVELGCEQADIDTTIHPHPTLCLRLTAPTFRRK
jgi:pyruvate/2-oxoglutarate dehydrogenase complex dihydrolipoamide dehydrogenase (E3) component